jgi:predicted Zn-dependent protease
MQRRRLRHRRPTIITRADRARAAGEWQLAAGLYRIALERTPNNPPIWIQYGHALKESGRLAEAETAYLAPRSPTRRPMPMRTCSLAMP